MKRLKNRTKDEFIQDVTGFLNELFIKFNNQKSVPYTQIQIEALADQYHIEGRLRRILIRHEFVLDKRRYTRKFTENPTVEDIELYIKEAKEQRSVESKRFLAKMSDEDRKKLYKKRYRHRKRTLTKEEKHAICAANYRKYVANWKTEEEKAAFYKNSYDAAVQRKLKWELLEREISDALPKLTSFCKRLTKDYEDLVQDACLAAWTVKRRYKSGTNISAWLIGIAVNIKAQKQKVAALHPEFLVDEFHDDVLGAEDPPEESIKEQLAADLAQAQMVKDITAKIKECFDSLPENHRVHIKLNAQGNNHTQIATILKKKSSSSKSLLYAARQLLLTKIQDKLNVKLSDEQAWDLLHKNLIPVD
jgi:RNA polymerase sigma factor (sigma-70 family)